jgi:N-acetyl-anhydromuramyl-L-alanine amidase AmpD
MKIDENHILQGNVRWRRSPNHSGLITGGEPDTVVIHYTGGGTLDGALNTLCNPSVSASAHIVIGREGEVVQLVPFNTIAWHAGKSHHEETGRSGLNKFSVGIELVNAGPMDQVGEDRYMAWFQKVYSGAEVMPATHRNQNESRYWHLFTEIQVEMCFKICSLLKEHYPIKYILGHDEISPDRKIDPGPAFNMERFREKLLFTGRDDESGDFHDLHARETESKAFVNAYFLNVRSGPHFKNDLVKGGPIELGTEVRIVSKSDKWCEVIVVDSDIKGWVNGKYLSKEKNQA